MDYEGMGQVDPGGLAREALWRVDALIVVAIVLLTGLVIHEWSAQPASRYLLTVALVDDHTIQLDRNADHLGIDHARSRGHIYTDKAPYQPLLAVPAYQLYRWAGADAFPAGFDTRELQNQTNYGLWWVTLWSSTLPAAALAIVLRRLVARTHADTIATAVALATILGTTIAPFAGWLFGHVLAALCVASAWLLVRQAATTRCALLAGALLGVGIGTDYTVAVIAAVILAHVALGSGGARVIAVSSGTMIATLPLLVYNWVAFGKPFETAYQGHLKSFAGEGALGVYNLQAPRLAEVGKALVGSRGLFVLTPIALLAVISAMVSIGSKGAYRRDAWVALASLTGLVIISTGIDGLGGDSPGPRYLIPAVPLLVTPMADAWRRAPRVCSGAAVFGASWMWVASVTTPAVDTSEPEPLRFWLERLVDGPLAVNILTGRDQPLVLIAATAAGLVAAAGAIRLSRAEPTVNA